MTSINNSNNLLGVGIDIGSLNARVAVSSNSGSGSEVNSQIISNTQGHRSTLALVTTEEERIHNNEEDNSNNNNNNNNNNNGTSVTNYIFGDAAQKSLHKQKIKDLTKYTIQYLLESAGQEQAQEGVETTAHEGSLEFIKHLCKLASDSKSIPIEQLRFVLSMPVSDNNSTDDDDNNNEVEESNNRYMNTLCQTTIDAWKSSFYDDKKKRQQNKKVVPILAVITDAAALCIAHGLTNVNSSSNNNNNNNILVINWNDDGLILTEFMYCGSSKILSQVRSAKESSLNSQIFIETISKFVSSQFERKNKIPSGEVGSNYKSKTKLFLACESALKSMASSSGATNNMNITIDGLYDGIDCHIPISKPRFEMLISALLKKATSFINDFNFNTSHEKTTILLSGFVGNIPSIKDLIYNKIYTSGEEEISKGKATIPTDGEGIALGCSIYANTILQFMKEHVEFTKLEELTNKNKMLYYIPPYRNNIMSCPITIALIGMGGKTTSILIQQGTPLPAHVTHTFKVMDDDDKDQYGLYQLLQAPLKTMENGHANNTMENGGDKTNNNNHKLIAKLNDLKVNDDVEIQVELTINGKLSLAIQGGPLVQI